MARVRPEVRAEPAADQHVLPFPALSARLGQHLEAGERHRRTDAAIEVPRDEHLLLASAGKAETTAHRECGLDAAPDVLRAGQRVESRNAQEVHLAVPE